MSVEIAATDATVDTGSAQSSLVAALSEKLRPFIERHRDAKISSVADDNNEFTFIENPWSDDSVILVLDGENEQLLSALNKVILPQRFSALYHIDLKKIEFVYTAYPLKKGRDHIKTRSFQLNYNNRLFDCAFGESSAELLQIAFASRPFSETLTNHRNLQSFHAFEKSKRTGVTNPSSPLGEPISFWVGPLDWDEDEIVSLARHLTFYMAYLDRDSPHILIHAPKIPAELINRTASTNGENKFPSIVVGRELDDILLQFWQGCIAGDSFTKFLNAYRIMEYSAFFYMDERFRNSIRRALASPDAFNDLDKIVDRISTTMGADKLQESQRIEALVKEYVSIDRLWSEISSNAERFGIDTKFDGGFSAPRLINKGWSQSDFETNAVASVTQALRKVRNALSHGKDQATALCITPTHHNMLRLRPWANLARTVAEDVMVYKRFAV